MAELALGLTKTAVQGTLNRVKSAIEEEGKLRVRVQDDLVFISGEFRMMQSFLKASNAGGRASQDEAVQEWVRQLRDLAFDVEDCVEFVVHLDKASPWDWVRRLASTLPCVASTPLPLDVAVVEIKRLKVRVEDLSQRNTRYNLFSTSGGGGGGGGSGGGGSSSDQQQLMHLPGRTTSSTPATMEAFHAVREVWEAMGKLIPTNGEFKRLIDCEGDELKVISLWRSPQADVVGELGWVTIAKKAYEDPEICQEFKNRAWVKLSTHHPFNPVEFLNQLLSHFTASRHHRRHDNISELMLQVSQDRYLIVLETELSSVADWDAIRNCLLDRKNGSRIIVSTKLLGIALVCTGDPYEVSELKHFSNDRYLCAIFPKGCGHRIGMDEFFWQLRRRCGVICLLCRTNAERRGVIHQLYDHSNRTFNLVDGVKFKHQCYVDATGDGLVNSARIILATEDEQDKVCEELTGENDDESIFGRCRELLNEHDCLFFIEDLKSIEDWKLFRKHLSGESTRGCTVVVTCVESVARHCVDDDLYRVLNVRDLLKGSDQEDQSEHSDGGSGTEEEGESKLEALVGREDDEYFFQDVYTGIGRTWSVWGIAGVGKSALVRQFYKRSMSRRKQIKYGWVDVPHPFNLVDLCQRLLLDLNSDGLDAKEAVAIGMMEGQDPIQGCCKFLSENKCILVFDGLRSTHDWDLIKEFLLSQTQLIRCMPIVITREKRVAEHCSENDHRHTLIGLQPEAALQLFTKAILDDTPLFPEAKSISELIVSKCGGLPEVILAIGKQTRQRAHNVDELLTSLGLLNDDFMGKLQNLKEFPSLGGLFCWMQSYFDACSDELKPCIFYMLVFPADQSIRQKRLFRRWIAEGYLSAGTADERGENLMLELWMLSVLHFEEDRSDNFRFKLNRFFREYIKSRPMEDNRVFELDGSCSPSPRLTGQHLSISCSWDRDEIVFRSLDLSRLRSFTVFGDWKSFLICDKMKLLRVLDLEGTSTSDGTASVRDEDLEQIGKLLPRLKCMCLRGCRLITRLPDSLGDMKQLQTLDAKDTSIVELPSAITTKLHKLQYLRVGTTETRFLSEPTTPSPAPAARATQEDGNDGTCPFLRAKAALSGVVQGASTGTRKMAHDLEETCSRLWHFKNLRRCRRVAKNGGGVEVVPAAAKGIGKLTELHTLGVVNVAGGTCALLFFKELKKLTQLRKLRLSGITRENWRDFCDAISGHHHLESLSLKLLLLEEEGGNYDFARFDNILKPPKTLTSIKVLYTTEPGAGAGGAWIRPTWIKQLGNSYINKFYHELTISSQEDMDIILYDRLQVGTSLLRIKPIEQRLSFEPEYPSNMFFVNALRIDCNSVSTMVTFGVSRIIGPKVLNIHCCSSCGLSSCLRISGLNDIGDLEKVLVTGPCSTDFKEDLRKQLEGHPNEPKVLPL